MIKISKAKAYSNGIIEVEYIDGIKGSFLYSDYFNFNGLLSPLKDKDFFTTMTTDHKTIKWGDEIDFCPDIIRSIITNQKIIHDDKIVFDPSLKQNGWIN